MTARNMQDAVKKKGLPWSAAKGFDTFCPVGPFIPKAKIGDTANVGLTLSINGAVKQRGTTADMIFDVPHLISFVSGIMKLEEGDLILTGTPAGVSQVKPGDSVEVSLSYPGLEGEVLDKYEVKASQREGGHEFKE
jgi:acylpyruvate hydrolase